MSNPENNPDDLADEANNLSAGPSAENTKQPWPPVLRVVDGRLDADSAMAVAATAGVALKQRFPAQMDLIAEHWPQVAADAMPGTFISLKKQL